MPAYNANATSVNKPVLNPGQPITLWNNEAVVVASPPNANAYSKQFCMHRHETHPEHFAIELKFSADPGAFEVDLETADTDANGSYVVKTIINSGLNASHVGRIEVVNVVAKFARLHMVTLTNGVLVTATVT